MTARLGGPAGLEKQDIPARSEARRDKIRAWRREVLPENAIAHLLAKPAKPA
jgi:hypothetical protein